jgi:uncharacterized protein YceK
MRLAVHETTHSALLAWPACLGTAIAYFEPVKRRLIILVLIALTGCATIENLTEGPVVYGGLRDIFVKRRDMEGQTFALADAPFSAVLDTALLPVTTLFELIRWMSGWPPSPGY